MTELLIPTFIINSKNRPQFKENILKEFYDKKEFDLNFIETFNYENTISDLWKYIQKVIQEVISTNIDYLLICKDSHQFTESYSKNNLIECIRQAKILGANILCGEVRSFDSGMRISENIFWIDDFSDSQFIFIFRSLFENVLKADHKTLFTANGKFFIYPLISKSDQSESFRSISNKYERGSKKPKLNISEQVELLDQVSVFFKELSVKNEDNFIEEDFENIVIPTYIINLPERIERLVHIKEQFAGKNEFDVQIIQACKNAIGAVGLWETIRKIIKIAIENDDDVIIICEDDHEFTSDYSKSFLLKNIMEACFQQAEMLLGGVCGLAKILPITNNRAWMSYSHCTQFTVLYKPVFEKILNEPYDDKVIADILLSKMFINKMILYPFISVQKYFGYSDVSKGNNDDKEMLNRNFARAKAHLKRIYEAKASYIDSKLI